MTRTLTGLLVVTLMAVLPAGVAAGSRLVESRPMLQLSAPEGSAPIDIGEAGPASFRFEGAPLVDFGEPAGGGSMATRMFEPQVAVRCRAEDRDILIANVGSDRVDRGTTIRWQVRETRERGFVNLTAELPPGQTLRARQALDQAAEGRCTARAY